MAPRSFSVTLRDGGRGRLLVPVPFDPDDVWGVKSTHHVRGTVGMCGVRGAVEPTGDGYGLILGPVWKRDSALEVGVEVAVSLEPEGPQRGELAPDVAAALAAHPAAGDFFDSLAQFYRRGYLRWIDATKRRPEVRAARIAEVVALLGAGVKERPRG